jgi:hypothetical protein
MKTLRFSLLVAGTLLLAGCEKTLLDPGYENNAVDNFECLWNNIDRNYGQFIVRNINWDSLYEEYRPQINEFSTTQELYDVFDALIGNLHDDHMFIDPTEPGFERIESGRSDTMKVQTDFSLDVVKTYYLVSGRQFSEHIFYGMLPGNIGYIQMDVFIDPLDFLGDAFDEILTDLGDTQGIVFDIRKLEGGDDRLARFVAGRFCTGSKLYMVTRKRNGPEHDDFESALQWHVVPEGALRYTKPVILLTGRFTASAGETFTWAMNENPSVTQVGDTTLGAFSDIMTMELPNGWIHTVAVGDYRNASGENLEGIGVEPAHVAKSSREETMAGIDRGLEKALELLQD